MSSYIKAISLAIIYYLTDNNLAYISYIQIKINDGDDLEINVHKENNTTIEVLKTKAKGKHYIISIEKIAKK